MKAIIACAALALGGCSTVTFNGQDIARLTAATAIAAIAAAILIESEKDDADKHSRCPSCPPFEPVD